MNTPTSPGREFARYASLNVLGMLGLSCYILADTFFIARGLGPDGLAALNLAIPVYGFIHGCGSMLGMGGATRFSLLCAQTAVKNARRVFFDTLCLVAGFALLFVLLGAFASARIAVLLGTDGDTFAMTEIYVRVLLLFAPAFLLNDALICFVRNDGDPRRAMLGLVVGSLANILLDYVFIFPLHMGMFGAVLATGIAPLLSLAVLSGHWRQPQHQLHPLRARLRRSSALAIFSLGLPSLVAEVSSGVVIIVFNLLILELAGNLGVAAYGIVANISLVVVAMQTGLAQGVQPLLSRACGQNDSAGVRQMLRYALTAMLAGSALIYLALCCGAEPIAAAFNSERNAQLQSMAVSGLRLYFIAILFVGFNILAATFFTATDKARPAQLIALLRGLIVIIPMAIVLARLLELTGVWLAFPLTELSVALLGLALLRRSPLPARGK